MCDFDNPILSSSTKFADTDSVGTLKSFSGAKNEQKNTQNNVIGG